MSEAELREQLAQLMAQAQAYNNMIAGLLQSPRKLFRLIN